MSSGIFLRLVNFLLTNWDGSDGGRVRMSQQELACAINCSRASVSRACRVLRQEGVIASDGIGFHILDPTKLEQLCQTYAELP